MKCSSTGGYDKLSVPPPDDLRVRQELSVQPDLAGEVQLVALETSLVTGTDREHCPLHHLHSVLQPQLLHLGPHPTLVLPAGGQVTARN